MMDFACLIVGTFAADHVCSGGVAIATTLVLFQLVCSYIAESRFAVAVVLIAIPNLILAIVVLADYTYRGEAIGAVFYLWSACTITMVVASLLVLVFASASDSRRVSEK